MSLRITVVIYTHNCDLFYNHCFPDVIDRNIFNVITLHICWAEIKEYCMYCIGRGPEMYEQQM